MALPGILPIQPFTRPARGEIALPGSKSITNRALLLASLCDRPVTLAGALFSDDTRLMIDALRRLGFTVEMREPSGTLHVAGPERGFSGDRTVELFVGLAGTAARFLTALCAAAPRGVFRIDGVPQMRKRPMRGLIDALRLLGADIRCAGEEGCLPVEIRARGLRGGPVSIDASESSQMLSALCMVAPLAAEPVVVRLARPVREPFVRMTATMMGDFGVGIAHSPGTGEFRLPIGQYRSPGAYSIEPDATAASYFLALPLAVPGNLFLPGLRVDSRSLQGDTRFAGVLRDIGVRIRERAGTGGTDDLDRRRAPGVESASGAGARSDGTTRDFSEFSDTFLTLAALAPLLVGTTRIAGVAHARNQETDRISGMARELSKLGQEVREHPDGLEISPRLDELRIRSANLPIEIETYGDHRFAMSFAVLGCHDLHGDGRAWLSIRNPACCAKTFPEFFEILESLRRDSFAKL